MTETEKMNAYIWAAKVHPDAVPLLDLKKGERFLWARDGELHFEKTYRGRGWYSIGNTGRNGRAGTKTAVIRIKE